MLIKVLIVLAIMLLLFLVVVALQPTAFCVKRSIKMLASPLRAFDSVNDFHGWQAWSPWEKLDRQMKKTYEGSSSGVGSVYSWTGNNKVGAGRMRLLESDPGKRIQIKLEFLKPFKATNTAEFIFEPQGDSTLVTWSMSGNKAFVMKAFGLFMSMDKLIGNDFEEGLANLKAVAELNADAAVSS